MFILDIFVFNITSLLCCGLFILLCALIFSIFGNKQYNTIVFCLVLVLVIITLLLFLVSYVGSFLYVLDLRLFFGNWFENLNFFYFQSTSSSNILFYFFSFLDFIEFNYNYVYSSVFFFNYAIGVFSWFQVFADIDFSLVLFFDFLSVSHMWLVCLLSIVCLGLLNRERMRKSIMDLGLRFQSMLICLLFVLFFVFSTLSLFWFYVWFELSLIPMTFIIGFWGGRGRRVAATYRFFLYTLLGSLALLLLLVLLFFFSGTFSLLELNTLMFTSQQQILFWFFFFFAMAVKVPLFPFHVWLPEAHAEAPTIGSIILAGILLKLGPYGLLRFSNVLFPLGLYYWSPFASMLCLIGLVYTSCIAIFEVDIKKLIAYSSIGHMAFVILGILCDVPEGLLGSLIILIAHGFVSSGLFLCVGLLYERYGTRTISYYGGLAQLNPILSWFFLFFILGNMSFPGSFNFVGEFLILYGIMHYSFFSFFVCVFSSILIVTYNIWLYTRLIGGKIQSYYLYYSSDLMFREIYLVLFLLVPSIIFGIEPSFFLFNFTLWIDSVSFVFFYNYSIL